MFRHPAFRAGLAVTLPLATASALIPWRSSVASAAQVLTLVLATVVVATITASRGAALAAAATSALAFDVLLTPPYLSLTMARRDDVVEAVLLGVIGVLVGTEAARLARVRAELASAGEQLSRVTWVAREAATGSPGDALVLATALDLRALLHLRDCGFTSNPAREPRPTLREDGAVWWGALRWPSERQGLPSHGVDLPVGTEGEIAGRFLLVPTVGMPVSSDRLAAARVLADQVALALLAERGRRAAA